MSYLLDTDICSAYLKGNHKVWQKFMQYSGRLRVSAITAAELFTWALRAKASAARLQGVQNMLLDVPLLIIDEAVARKFGEIRAAQLDQGQCTPEMDLLIASTALVHGLALVTHNVQDFGNVPGLTIEDWFVP